ncbi:MAG TPA: Ig-like domain-containing protein [Chthoniobacterales bacterium]
MVFPASSFLGSNYYVDVVFFPKGVAAPPQPPLAKNDNVTATLNTSLPIPVSSLLANDTDPGGLTFSLFSVTSGSHGTVTWSAGASTVTFTL